MSSFRFLSLNLLGGSVLLLLLLSAACEAKDYSPFTPPPDYDSDYNATFDYSFYSNTSTDDLEKFRELFVDPEEDEEEETEGQQDLLEDVTVTPSTTRRTTEKSRVNVLSAATLPSYLELRMLVWTLVILTILNSQQL